jgi:hypothetical protein
MSAPKGYKPLRLLAEDAEDLKVISACLQDAVLKVGDFAYLPSQRRFAFVANRFVWEDGADRKAGPFFRTRTGAHFDDVTACKHQNIKTDAKDGVVELLAIRFEPGADGAGAVVLDFSGGGAIRLDVDAISAELRDMTDPWRTQSKPAHE